MLTGRRCGGTRGDVLAVEQDAARRPASRSRRACRSSVVLPQPDGPSSAKNSRSKMSSDTPSTAATLAEALAHALEPHQRPRAGLRPRRRRALRRTRLILRNRHSRPPSPGVRFVAHYRAGVTPAGQPARRRGVRGQRSGSRPDVLRFTSGFETKRPYRQDWRNPFSAENDPRSQRYRRLPIVSARPARAVCGSLRGCRCLGWPRDWEDLAHVLRQHFAEGCGVAWQGASLVPEDGQWLA